MEPKKQLILSLCDFSRVWGSTYEDAYDVLYLDLQGNPAQDIRLQKYLSRRKVHGILAAPPCTHLAVSVAWKWAEKGDSAVLEAMSIVDACLRMVAIYKPEFWVLENPVGRLKHYLGKYRMTFNPCDYAGHSDTPQLEAYTKRTCLWGEFNTALIPNPVPATNALYIRDLPPSPNRHNLRSKTPQGFARAFRQANP